MILTSKWMCVTNIAW